MTFQALAAVSPSDTGPAIVGTDDLSEALRWEQMQGHTPGEGLSDEYDELDRDAFGGVFT